LLEEQLSIEYEDIVDKITDKIENHNEISNENNLDKENHMVKKEIFPIEKTRKYSLFSDNALENQKYSPSFEVIEKNIKINLLIKEDNNKTKNYTKKGDELFFLNLKIDSNITIFDLIKNAVDAFNEKFRNENFRYLLNNNYSNYKLKASKKNGYPNTDIPGDYRYILF